MATIAQVQGSINLTQEFSKDSGQLEYKYVLRSTWTKNSFIDWKRVWNGQASQEGYIWQSLWSFIHNRDYLKAVSCTLWTPPHLVRNNVAASRPLRPNLACQQRDLTDTTPERYFTDLQSMGGMGKHAFIHNRYTNNSSSYWNTSAMRMTQDKWSDWN